MRRIGNKSITLSLLATATGIETPGRIADSTKSTNIIIPIPPPSNQQQQQQQKNELDSNTTTITNTNTTITAQLKDPPAYSIESSTSALSSPIPVARQSTVLENQSTSQSSPTPSQSSSKDLQQPQNLTDTAETKTTVVVVAVAAPIATAAESISIQITDVVTTNKPSSTSVQQQKEFDACRNENNDGSCDQTQNKIDDQLTPGSLLLVDSSEGTGEKAPPPIQPPAKQSQSQSQQPAEIDIGVKVMGIPLNILGMKIERTDKSSIQGSNNHDLENNSSNNRKQNKYNKNSKLLRRSGGVAPKYDCHVQCLGYDTNAAAAAAAVIDSDLSLIHISEPTRPC